MDQIAIQDANILIDLITIDMFSICLSSPYRFVTTEIILAELHDHQIEEIQPHIRSGKFAVIPNWLKTALSPNQRPVCS